MLVDLSIKFCFASFIYLFLIIFAYCGVCQMKDLCFCLVSVIETALRVCVCVCVCVCACVCVCVLHSGNKAGIVYIIRFV